MTSEIFSLGYRFKKPAKKTLKKVQFKEVAIPKLHNTKRMSSLYNVAKGNTPMFRNKRSEAKILRMTSRKNSNISSVINKTKNIGMNRIKQQQGLKPLGDFDHDGLINMLDCNPRNFFEQGPSHTVETKLRDDMYVPEDYEPEYKEPAPSVAKTDADILRERQEREAILRAKAYEKAQKLKESQYVRDQVKLQRYGSGPQLTRKEKALRTADKVISAPGQGISAFSSAVTGGLTSMGGFGINQAKLTQGTGMSKANKLRVFLGKEPIPEQQAVAVPQAQPVAAASPAQAPQQQGVMSPYSKRRVTYVRGPYKK